MLVIAEKYVQKTYTKIRTHTHNHRMPHVTHNIYFKLFNVGTLIGKKGKTKQWNL